jgi:hypothetical protein
MKIHAIISVFFLSSITAIAQTPREEIVSAEYTYTVRDNENITFGEAKRKCIELAQAEAIRNKYGEIITSDFIDSRVNKDGESSDSYYWENTVARAKGVWLGNSEGFPKFDVAYSDGFIVFTAKVQGLAREIIQSTIDLKWSIMKDGINDRVTAETFDSGERFYVNFRSPADGYVAVYLLEGDDVTSCLLPYSKDPDGRCPVKAGRDYVFFDKNTDPYAPHYVLKTKYAQENNQLIIIYSPNSFTKCNDKVTEKNRPRSLNTSEFQKWLLGCQRMDNDMVVNKKWIKIDNKQQ